MDFGLKMLAFQHVKPRPPAVLLPGLACRAGTCQEAGGHKRLEVLTLSTRTRIFQYFLLFRPCLPQNMRKALFEAVLNTVLSLDGRKSPPCCISPLDQAK